MSYKLKFLPSALKEWNRLGSTIREQLKKKLQERLIQPVVPGDRLHGFPNHYKIKLRSSGYRLVYEVDEGEISVIVISVGKRDRSKVYSKAKRRSEEGMREEEVREEVGSWWLVAQPRLEAHLRRVGSVGVMRFFSREVAKARSGGW